MVLLDMLVSVRYASPHAKHRRRFSGVLEQFRHLVTQGPGEPLACWCRLGKSSILELKAC
ncbi:MAG: hypothetical protein DMF17_00500 [Verrucomicrobia bacterium]|nr:MAG: hypothetical protein DMF17_00500 [Verrucomicrobiota bacterium]